MGLGKAGGNKDGCGKMRSIRSGWMEIRDLVPDSPELTHVLKHFGD